MHMIRRTSRTWEPWVVLKHRKHGLMEGMGGLVAGATMTLCALPAHMPKVVVSSHKPCVDAPKSPSPSGS